MVYSSPILIPEIFISPSLFVAITLPDGGRSSPLILNLIPVNNSPDSLSFFIIFKEAFVSSSTFIFAL